MPSSTRRQSTSSRRGNGDSKNKESGDSHTRNHRKSGDSKTQKSNESHTNHRKGGDSRNNKNNDSYESRSSNSRESGIQTPKKSSSGSCKSQSTTPTSLYTSPRPSDVSAARASGDSKHKECYREDVSPSTSLYPRSSVDTYASTTASEKDLDHKMELDDSMDYEDGSIPPLPAYRHEAVEPNARPSTPPEFGRLFPSLNRLSIRHDEFTSDGNMNLRVDTVVTGRRRTAIQLFHLRMYDLARREFSLRRYCRDSGREVCNAKRQYVEQASSKPPKTADTRPSLQRSVTSAIKALGGGGRPSFRRTNSDRSMLTGSRPDAASFSSDSDDEETFDNSFSRVSLDSTKSAGSRGGKSQRQRPEPTNTIKLEFSNYARVDVTRRGGHGNKRYEFEWWGHRYAWRRETERATTGRTGTGPSFTLVRDGNAAKPVAFIVPETRSPNQVLADESAGGWVPPCYMWIADESVLDALTDVADVIMATGLMALVDDCIKEKWQTKNVHRIPLPLTSRTVDVPRALMPQIFTRRHTDGPQHTAGPPRYNNAIPAY